MLFRSGSFIFVGPTGVGKTYLARSLAEYLFDDPDALIRIDMSEYQERHTVSRLLGAPPGYVGYENAGELTEAVRRRPYRVILFDEIEKAHPDVVQLMLQILEDGRLTDSLGRTVDFRNTIILMTTNVGAQLIQRQTTMGFAAAGASDFRDLEKLKEKVLEEAKRIFKPEFLNRINHLVVFKPLGREELVKIVDIEVGKVTKRLAMRNIHLEFSPESKSLLIDKGYDEKYGARPLRRAVERYLEDPLAEALLRGDVKEGEPIVVVRNGDKLAPLVADIDAARAAATAGHTRSERVRSTQVDASSTADLVELIAATRADVVVNACDPRFNPPIFDAAYAAGSHYLDMAMHMSTPHPTHPYERPGVMLGDAQFAVAHEWAERGQLAIVGMGVEPGFSDVVTRYAADHLFSRIDEVGVRDGADLVIHGVPFAPTFSIWTTIEECLNPPLIWERERGWYTTEPFSEPEVFDFPEGIGPVECVNVEHEEVALIPRWIDCDRVTFKYGLGEEFIDVLRTLHKLGLDSTDPVEVRGQRVSPRDVVAAALPNPAHLGDRMHGRTCAGTYVTGLGPDGAPRAVYLFHVSDNDECMARHGSQAVVWQTAINPVVAMELIADGTWSGTGVLGPEAFDAVPFLDRLRDSGEPWGMEERTPPA